MFSVKTVLIISEMACTECEVGKYMHISVHIRSEASLLSELTTSCTLSYLWDWWLCDWQSWRIHAHLLYLRN